MCMLNKCLELNKVSVKRTYALRQWFNTFIPHWPTVGCVAYSVVCLVMHEHDPWVIDMLSHCMWYGSHRQYECQRGITLLI